MSLVELLRTGAKSTLYLCKALECDLEELYDTISVLNFAGYRIDTFEEGGKTYVFIEI